MTAELGQILLLGALVVSLLLGILPMWGAYRGNETLMRVAPRAA